MKTNNTKYYIDYICNKVDGQIEAYFQLVRRADDAILYANPSLDLIFSHCFQTGIHHTDIVIL